jgi:hypothetical protein
MMWLACGDTMPAGAASVAPDEVSGKYFMVASIE